MKFMAVFTLNINSTDANIQSIVYLCIMKFRFLILVIMTSMVSCKKQGGLLDFNLKYDTSSTINPGTPISLPFEIMTPPINSNSETELEGRGSQLNLINYVRLKKLELSITSPSGKTFSFLRDIFIYINADGLEEKLIASKENIPDNVGSVLNLDQSGENLKEYIKKKNFSIRLSAVTDETLTQKVDINIHSEYDVNAKLK